MPLLSDRDGPERGADPRRRSRWTLLAVNALPLAGVLLLGWDVGALVALYWSENLAVGFYNILKMLVLRGVAAVPMVLFFTIHYGGFCAVHGLFVLSMLLEHDTAALDHNEWPFILVFVELLVNVAREMFSIAPSAWIIAFCGLMVSHGYSFVTHFLIGGERDRTDMNKLMGAPYGRIVVMHIAVLAGGFGIAALGEPLILLLALVLMKTLIDLRFHDRSHRSAEPSTG